MNSEQSVQQPNHECGGALHLSHLVCISFCLMSFWRDQSETHSRGFETSGWACSVTTHTESQRVVPLTAISSPREAAILSSLSVLF